MQGDTPMNSLIVRLVRDRRGAAFTEYLVAVAGFGIVLAIAMTSKAQTLMIDYGNARDLVLLPAM